MAIVLDGNLSIATPDGVATLRGGPAGAVLALPDGDAGARILRGLLQSIGGRTGLRAADGTLRRLGLGIEVEQGGRTLAQLGAGAQGSRLGRAAGIGDVELRLGALLRLVVDG